MPNEITIALWGPPQAGKTVFLAQMFLRQSDEWEVLPTLESQRFIAYIEKFFNSNRFPEATSVVTETRDERQIKYRFRNSRTGSEATLFVEDRAGEESVHLDEDSKRRLNDADGLILLFDPMRNAIELEQQIRWTLSELYVARNAKYAKPVAVCLSKADRKIVTPEDLRRAVREPRQFVLEKVAPGILNWVSILCEDFELFPISSLGVRVCHGVIEPVAFFDEEGVSRLASRSDPINLHAPFSWVFSRLEGGSK